jgi:hypothetical protein
VDDDSGEEILLHVPQPWTSKRPVVYAAVTVTSTTLCWHRSFLVGG